MMFKQTKICNRYTKVEIKTIIIKMTIIMIIILIIILILIITIIKTHQRPKGIVTCTAAQWGGISEEDQLESTKPESQHLQQDLYFRSAWGNAACLLYWGRSQRWGREEP